MPQTKQKKPVALAGAPKPERRYAYRIRDVAVRVRQNAKDRLKGLLDDFQAKAWPEEHALMLNILQNRDNVGGSSFARRRSDFEPPLFTAIAEAMEDEWCHILLVPDDAIMPQVEEHIALLVKQKEAGEPLPPRGPSEIRARRENDLIDTLQLEFFPKSSTDDFFLLEELLSMWRDFMAYDESDRPQRPLLQAAFDQRGTDTEVFTAEYRVRDQARVLVEQVQKLNWLGELLRWIGEQGLEKLAPCLIASKAAGMQEAWDKAQERAA